MERRQAQSHIKEILEQPFDWEKFTNFVRNLLNNIEPRDNHYRGGSIWEAYRDHIAQYWRIGKYTDPNGEAIDILIVETKSLAKLDRARTALRNFVVRHIKQFDKEQALVAFYAKEDNGADWRFSFVKVEQEAEQNAKGKVTLKSVLSPAKRYSYLVGQHEHSYTAQKQLLPLLERDYANPTSAEIEAAFSVEKVTAEFFEQYKDLYLKLFEHLQRESVIRAVFPKDEDLVRFAKKLLGQIVFLYFVQKKGWLGVPDNAAWGQGKRRFLSDLFAQTVEQGQNFYHDALQYLFYEALAQKQTDSYYPRFGCKIPFLNGGLFEADYDWRNQPLTIPNHLFRNNERNQAGDIGTGILDVFDRYNFTIKEDEPLEKEVAVDPEMLGKVFENMLEIAERKSKGAFYTPREIVHYMCQESLIHYLDNALNSNSAAYREWGSPQIGFLGNEYQTGQLLFTEEQPASRVPQADLEELIRYGHLRLENDQRVLERGKETQRYEFQLPASVRENAALLDEKLRTIKICDPAIGSGAFPVGLLHEIVNARLVLQAFIPPLARGRTGGGESAYHLKRHAILESIYGVDIDASAIDIARLRLWLSLIVDEDDFESIDALPNLDYKIVRGNSLIGFPENWNSPNLRQIAELQRNFATTTDQTAKQQLKAEIDEKIRQRLANSVKVLGYQVDFDYQLWFSEVWREKGGFDVVIGNPPYGASLSDEQKKFLKNRFKDIVERIRNTFMYFMGLSETLISGNDNGTVILIIPNEFLFQIYMTKARNHYLTKRHLHTAINIGESAFKAIVPTCIVGFDSKVMKEYKISVFDFRKSNLIEIAKRLGTGRLSHMNSEVILKTPNHTFAFDPQISDVVSIISQEAKSFEDFCDDIANGISTGCDDVYVVEDKIVKQRLFENKYTKPTLKGKDFIRFSCPNSTNKYILYIDKDFNQSDGQNIYSYLQENKDLLISKSIEKTAGTRDWHILFRSRYKELFSVPKILVRQTSDKIIAAVDDRTGYYCIDSVNVVQLGERYRDRLSLRYFVGLLNSDVLNFYYQQISQEAGRVLAQVKPSRLKSLPIIYTKERNIIAIVVLYVEHLANTSHFLQTSYYKDLLNALVYELYFPDQLKAAHKELLPYLGELTLITDAMSDEAKLAIIQHEFERLYDPHHPVRNHLETLDSVEVVRIIQGALKS